MGNVAIEIIHLGREERMQQQADEALKENSRKSAFKIIGEIARGRVEQGKMREQQLKVIETCINVGYDLPRAFSEAVNPFFAIMRPYSHFLHEQTRIMAYFLSEAAGHHDELANDYWLAAQKFVGSLAASAGVLSSSADENFEQQFHMLQEAVPIPNYFERVSELAQVMSRNAQPAYTNAVDFWVAAEKHVLTISAKSITNAKNFFDATESLRGAFSKFEAVSYLAGIQQSAYYNWKALGERPGHALDDWLQAEARALALER